MKKKWIYLLAVLGMCLEVIWGFSGCDVRKATEDNGFQIYMLNKEETKVEAHSYSMAALEKEDMLDELLEALAAQSEKLEYKPPLSMGFHTRSVNMVDNKIYLDMDENYKNLSPITEVLVRAAVVRTLTQIPGVRYVQFTVEGTELYDQTGNVVGAMSAEMFIDNDGNEINTYELARVKLYFANSTGDHIISAYREKYYSSNMPMERFILEELIAGPSGKVDGLYPTLNPETRILGVTTQDGVCYVNLDAGFQKSINNVSTEVAIYSIVDSLVELNNVNKVQILVNGEIPAGFAKSAYEKNLDYVTTLKPNTENKAEGKSESKNSTKNDMESETKSQTK